MQYLNIFLNKIVTNNGTLPQHIYTYVKMNICMRCGKQLPSPAMTKQDCSHLSENRKCIIFAYSRSQCLSIIQSEFY